MKLNIYKIKDGKSSISFCPERWWLITSIIINWTELLYMNEETLFDKSRSIRWWIPVLFPNAWVIPDEQVNYWYNLKQHWFARNIAWDYEILDRNKFKMNLSQDLWTRDMFDYNFKLELFGEIIGSNKVTITQNIINTWLKDLPVCSWLHPYFRVPYNKKEEIKFVCKNGDKMEDQIVDRANWIKTSFKNPKKFKVFLPWIWEINMEFSSLFERVWLWSESWKDYVCIEPIMRDDPSILDNPYKIKVWETATLQVSYSI